MMMVSRGRGARGPRDIVRQGKRLWSGSDARRESRQAGVRKCVALEERDWSRVVRLNLGRVSRSAVVLPRIFCLPMHLRWALQEGIWLVCGGIAVGLFLRVGLFQIIGLVVLHDRLVAGCRGGFAWLGGKEGKGRLVRLEGSQS